MLVWGSIGPIVFVLPILILSHFGLPLVTMMGVVDRYMLHGAIFYVFSQVSHIQHECFDDHIVTDKATAKTETKEPSTETKPKAIAAKRHSATSRSGHASGSDLGRPRKDWAIAQVSFVFLLGSELFSQQYRHWDTPKNPLGTWC